MASRRRGAAVDVFGGGQDYDLQSVDNALFGGLEAAQRNRVFVRPVNPYEIEVDQAIQVRVGGLDTERVEMLTRVLLNGGEFKDPIQVVEDDDGRQWLADGFHRHAATLVALDDPRALNGEIEIAPLKAEIRSGSYDDAITFSEEANLKHGEPLTKDDLKHLLFRRLARGHDWTTASNRLIARALGVSHPTIKAWKEEFSNENGKHFPLREKHEKKIVTESGEMRDISGVVKANKKRAKQPPTTTQLKRRIVRNLRAAADDLKGLDRVDLADGLSDWIRQLQEDVLK